MAGCGEKGGEDVVRTWWGRGGGRGGGRVYILLPALFGIALFVVGDEDFMGGRGHLPNIDGRKERRVRRVSKRRCTSGQARYQSLGRAEGRGMDRFMVCYHGQVWSVSTLA